MTDDDDRPLDPALRDALLADEGGPSREQRARLADRLSVTTGVRFEHTPVGTPARPARMLPKILAASAIFVAGIGIGIGVDRLRERPVVVAPVVRDAGVMTDAPVADAAHDAALDAPAPPPPPVDAAITHARSNDAAPSDAGVAADQLARERRLLDMARAALRAGDSRLAAKSLIEHELRYPDGALREERLVLQIELAVQRGDGADAARRADAFRREFPSSVFAARVDELVPH